MGTSSFLIFMVTISMIQCTVHIDCVIILCFDRTSFVYNVANFMDCDKLRQIMVQNL